MNFIYGFPLSVFFGTCPVGMHTSVQAILLSSKGVTRHTRAAFRRVPHQESKIRARSPGRSSPGVLPLSLHQLSVHRIAFAARSVLESDGRPSISRSM